jgi:hypothetical protein
MGARFAFDAATRAGFWATNRSGEALIISVQTTKNCSLMLLRRSLEDVEAELTIAQGGYHELTAFIRRIGLVVAPPAKRHKLIQIEIGAPLGALDDVVDIQASPHATGLATPGRSREDLRPNRHPFRSAGRATAQSPWAAGSYPPCRRLSYPPASLQHDGAPLICPRGQSSVSGSASCLCSSTCRRRPA